MRACGVGSSLEIPDAPPILRLDPLQTPRSRFSKDKFPVSYHAAGRAPIVINALGREQHAEVSSPFTWLNQ